MLRIRTVKPELHKHEDLFALEQETGWPMRTFWTGLFAVADREGRFKWRPAAIKSDIAPYDDVVFSDVLHAFHSAGFLEAYEHKGEFYGLIPSFKTHQVINNKESASKIPAIDHPDSKKINDVSMIPTREPRVKHAIATPLFPTQGEGKGKEGKGKEGNEAHEPRVINATAEVLQLRKPSAPAPGKTQDLIGIYCMAFKARYGVTPPISQKLAGQFKTFLKDFGYEKSVKFIEAYLDMSDYWFVTKRHDFATLLANLNSVAQFIETGRTITRKEAVNMDSMNTTQNLLTAIDNEEI